MMNPSTADPMSDDSTVYNVANMPWPGALKALMLATRLLTELLIKRFFAKLPILIGPDNDKHLLAMALKASLVVFAYGAPGSKALRERGPAVAKHLRDHAKIQPHVLKLSMNGTPWHPLYLKDELQASIWNF
jgi:hypothetical protein